MEYGKLSWPEIKVKAEAGSVKSAGAGSPAASPGGKPGKKPVVILVLGAVEEHGPHLPVDTDTFIPFEMGKRLAEKTGALLLPPITFGYCHTLRIYPATLSLRSRTLYHIVKDVASELVRNGFDKILVLNGHGGNEAVAKHALKELSDELKFTANIVSWWDIIDPEVLGKNSSLGHADENEASVYAFFAKEFVHAEKVKQEKTQGYLGYLIPTPKDLFTPSGYHGSVQNISFERGRKIVENVEGKLVKLVQADLILKQ